MNVRSKPLIWVVVAGLLLGLPVLLFGFPFPTHDGRTHEIWYANFSAQFVAGEWYPRWLQNMDGGLGGPTFFFYPPVPFLITSLFEPLFQSGPQAWHILGFSAALALVLSGLSAYAWLRETADARSSAIAAILFMVMPYHFAMDLHTRGAFGEIWSFVWMPLVLCFVARLVQRKRFAAVGLAISYAMLIMTHLPTTLIFSLVPPVYALWLSQPGERARAFVSASSAMALGVGVSSISLLPAMMDQAGASMHAMRTGDYYYAKAFFFPSAKENTRFLIAQNIFTRDLFGITLTTAALGACAWFLARQSSDGRVRSQAVFWVVVGAFAVAMMFRIGQPLYELIPPLQLIQFPWRFNAVLTVSVAAIVALGLASLEKPYPVRTERVLALGAILVFSWTTFTFRPLAQTSFGDNPHLTGPLATGRIDNRNTPEYRPRWVTTNVRQMLLRLRAGGDTIPKLEILSGAGTSRVSDWTPRSVSISANAESAMTLEVRRFYFPGWTATLDGRDVIALSPADSTGLMRVSVPAGAHTLDLRLGASRAEWLGQWVSAVSLVIVGLMALASLVATTRVRD